MCLLTVLLGFITSATTEAQQIKDRKTAIGRPAPQAMRVQVVKGQTVRITLSCTTISKAARVEYLVRDFPTLGVIGTLIPTPEDRTKATIIYQSARQNKGKVDMFSFYARYHGGHFSAPAQVIIELSDPEAKIETPASIDFGNLTLGDEAVRKVLLKNAGNIEFRRQIQLPRPLDLIEPADGKLAIPAGESVILKIRYRPDQLGAFTTNVLFQEKAGTTFIGNASAPFVVSTKKLTLHWDERMHNRQGELQITNKANVPISIKVRPPLRTQYLADNSLHNKPLTLLPGKSKPILIALPKEDVKSFKGTLLISTDQYQQKVSLESSPTPPLLKIELPDPSIDHIDFGTALPGDTVSRTFMIRNTGGTASIMGIGALPPFQIIQSPDATRSNTYSVGPESSAAFTVNFIAPPKSFGNYSDNLYVNSNIGAINIPLTALINNPNPMAGQTPLPPQIKKTGENPGDSSTNFPLPPPSPLPPLPDPESNNNHLSPTGFYTRDYIARKYSDNIPTPSEFNLHKAGRHELTLTWKIPDLEHTVFEIEMRQMLLNQKTFGIESVWIPFHDVEFRRSKGMVYASIEGLNPATIYEFRVLTAGTGGYFSQPSTAFGAWTQAPYDYSWLKWTLFILILFVIGQLLRLYWNKHDGSIPMPTYWPRTIPWPFE